MYHTLAEEINRLAIETKGIHNYSYIGAVVGGTYPEEAKQIRRLLSHSIFLVPGFGMQGGKTEDLTEFFDSDGMGALISSSRGINYCYTLDCAKDQWSTLSKDEIFIQIKESALNAKLEINKVRQM